MERAWESTFALMSKRHWTSSKQSRSWAREPPRWSGILVTLTTSSRSCVSHGIHSAPVSLLVYNAGMRATKSALDCSVDEWQKLIDINLSATFYFIRSVVEDMKNAEFGVSSLLPGESPTTRLRVPLRTMPTSQPLKAPPRSSCSRWPRTWPGTASRATRSPPVPSRLGARLRSSCRRRRSGVSGPPRRLPTCAGCFVLHRRLSSPGK